MDQLAARTRPNLNKSVLDCIRPPQPTNPPTTVPSSATDRRRSSAVSPPPHGSLRALLLFGATAPNSSGRRPTWS